MRFLVVDDEEDVRVLLRIYLQSVGHEVSVAATAAAARERCAEQRPDVLLLDVTLPGEDGPTLLQSLRDADLAPDAVFLMSAVPPLQLRQLADAAGALALTKPFTMASLKATLAMVS